MKQKETMPLDTFSTNQTNFSAEEPLFESAGIPNKPLNPDESTQSGTNSFIQTKAFKIGVGITIAIGMLLFGLVVVLMRNNGGTQVITPTPMPVGEEIEADSLQLRINALYEHLLEADPVDDQLPLPPVDLTISLEE